MYLKTETTFDMERSIARCRVFLSLISILALYVDPMEPTLTRWLPLGGGAFTLNRYWVTVLVGHLTFSVTLFGLAVRGYRSQRLATFSIWGDVLFAAAVALVTEGTTSPFYSFFAFAVLAASLRSGLVSALLVTALSTALYVILVLATAPPHQTFFIVMRAAYIAITGYLVAYLGQERLNQEERIRGLEAGQQRERIARSLHDGYAQALAGVNLRLETCRELFRRGRNAEALEELEDLQTGVNREHDQLRAYIRSLVDMDVNEKLPKPVDSTEIAVHANFTASAEMVEQVLLIILEGARNVRRHAHAENGTITVRSSRKEILISIDDDGVGFAPDAEPPWSMVSRVAECGGRLTVKQGMTGGHLRIELPES